MINGKSLLRLDISALCKMNIKLFNDAIEISNAIRMLFNIEKLLFSRSISLPERYPTTHYKLQKIQTGSKYELLKPTELYCDMKILKMKEIDFNHWEKLSEWLKHNPHQQKFRFGRQQKLKIVDLTADIVPKKIFGNDVEKSQNFMSSCEKNWTDDMLKLPWKLTCLIQRETVNFSTDL